MITNKITIEMFDDGNIKFTATKDVKAIIHMLVVVIKMIFDNMIEDKQDKQKESKIIIPKMGVN